MANIKIMALFLLLMFCWVVKQPNKIIYLCLSLSNTSIYVKKLFRFWKLWCVWYLCFEYQRKINEKTEILLDYSDNLNAIFRKDNWHFSPNSQNSIIFTLHFHELCCVYSFSREFVREIYFSNSTFTVR